MNIAYVTADFGVPVFGYKGASRHVRELVAAFGRAGHSVCVLSPAMEEPPGETESNFGDRRAGEAVLAGREPGGRAFPGAVEFVTVPPAERHLAVLHDLLGLDDFVGRRTSIRQELRSLLYNVALADGALPYLRGRGIDFVYERYAAFGYGGIAVARALGVPHVLEVNAPLAFEHEKRRGMEVRELARDAERRIFLATDQVVVVSRELGDLVTAQGVPAARVTVLPNAVDPERFAPGAATDGQALRRRYRLEGTRVIGFVGSLKPWHGTETLVEAFHRLHATAPHTRLLIVGDGPERQALERRVEAHRLGDTVCFTGNVSPDEVPASIAAMDVAVAPYVPSETFYYSPLKIFEYMAMAKPVVAGSIGQVRELVRDGDTGLLFEPGSVEQLTRALGRLVEDPPLCERMGAKGRAWILAEHSWMQNAEKLVRLAAGLLEASRAAVGRGV